MILIPLVSNIKLIVAKTNSSHTVLYVLNEKKNTKYPIRHYVYVQCSGKKVGYLDPGFPFITEIRKYLLISAIIIMTSLTNVCHTYHIYLR